MAFYYVFPVLILFLHDPRGAESAVLGPWAGAGLICGAELLLVAALRWTATRLGRRVATADANTGLGADSRQRAMRRLQRAQNAVFFLLLVGFFLQVHVFHMPFVLPSHNSALASLALLLPAYLPVLLVRWAALPAVRALRQLPLGTGEYLRFHTRALLIFAAPPLLYVFTFRWILFSNDLFLELADRHPGLVLVGAALLIFLLLLGAPALVRHLFPREPLDRWLPEAEHACLQNRLTALAERVGVRLGRIWIWRTGGVRVANAAVAGIVSRWQQVFVSDVLLERLGAGQLDAVLAHEMGHLRLRHPLLNYLLALSALGMLALGLMYLWPLVAPLAGAVGVRGGESASGVLFPIVVLVLNGAYVLVVFRLALNRFELQADAIAAEAMGGAEVFISALSRIVDLNLSQRRRGSITHPSPIRRVIFLRELGDGEPRRRWLRRQRRLNLAMALVALSLLVCAAVAMELHAP